MRGHSNEQHFETQVQQIKPEDKRFHLNALIDNVKYQFKNKYDYIFMLCPVSIKSHKMLMVIFNELKKQKIHFHYFIGNIVGMSFGFVEQLFFMYNIKNFYRILSILTRISRILDAIVEDDINQEPFLNFTTLEEVTKISIKYKLEMIDVYRIISRMKHKYINIYQQLDLTPEKYEEMVRIYLERQKQK